MNKLLSSHFSRLRKDKALGLCILLLVVAAVLVSFNNFRQMKVLDTAFSLDRLFFGFNSVIGIIVSSFCSLFIGTEYSDGTMRNKIVAGHSRVSIYLSNFIVSFLAALLACAAYLAVMLILGIPLFGFLQADYRIILLYLLASILLVLSYTSVFTLLSMNNQNKAVASICNTLLFFGMLILALHISSKLDEPPTWDSYVALDENGDLVTGDAIPNPNYLEGTQRTVYEFFNDFLPAGQSIQLSAMDAAHFLLLPLYSLLITIVCSLGGILLFQKKDIN